MKSFAAVAIVAATLVSSIAVGAVFFAPNANPQQFANDDLPGHVRVVVNDDDKDPIEKVTVFATDMDNKVVDTKVSDDSGHADMDLPKGGTYILHIDNAPTGPNDDYDEGGDSDQGAQGQCGVRPLTRCITIQVTGSVVHYPRQTAVDQVSELRMFFLDRVHEPRVEVVVELNNSNPPKLITGGLITIDPVAKGKTLESGNVKGRTRTGEIARGRYDISFAPPTGYRLVDPDRKVRNEDVQRLLTVTYKVEPIILDSTEPSSIEVEPSEEQLVGGQEFAVEEAPIEEEAPVEEEAPIEEEVPVEEAPVEDTAAQDALQELKADCFMYLEMYPQLQELDPGLPAWCEANPADARRIIGGLIDELGL